MAFYDPVFGKFGFFSCTALLSSVEYRPLFGSVCLGCFMSVPMGQHILAYSTTNAAAIKINSPPFGFLRFYKGNGIGQGKLIHSLAGSQ